MATQKVYFKIIDTLEDCNQLLDTLTRELPPDPVVWRRVAAILGGMADDRLSYTVTAAGVTVVVSKDQARAVRVVADGITDKWQEGEPLIDAVMQKSKPERWAQPDRKQPTAGTQQAAKKGQGHRDRRRAAKREQIPALDSTIKNLMTDRKPHSSGRRHADELASLPDKFTLPEDLEAERALLHSLAAYARRAIADSEQTIARAKHAAADAGAILHATAWRRKDLARRIKSLYEADQRRRAKQKKANNIEDKPQNDIPEDVDFI